MSDPRAKLYDTLESVEGGEELKAEVKAYFEKIIGQSAKAKADAKAEAEAEIAKIKEEYETKLADVPKGDGNTDSAIAKQLEALKKDFDAQKQKAEALEAEKARTAMSEKLSQSLSGLDEIDRSAVITALRTEGLTIGGKTFKATLSGEDVVLDVNGESNTLTTGIDALMEAGLSSKVKGDAGGGMPSFDAKQSDTKLTLSDAVNAVYKK